MNLRCRCLATTLVALSLGACTPPADEPVAPAPEPQGREETRNIRNTDAIGYSGAAVADRVDGALDAAERRQQELRAQDPAAADH
jgi:hypothetical protein